jgi:hypothetical protein
MLTTEPAIADRMVDPVRRWIEYCYIYNSILLSK